MRMRAVEAGGSLCTMSGNRYSIPSLQSGSLAVWRYSQIKHHWSGLGMSLEVQIKLKAGYLCLNIEPTPATVLQVLMGGGRSAIPPPPPNGTHWIPCAGCHV